MRRVQDGQEGKVPRRYRIRQFRQGERPQRFRGNSINLSASTIYIFYRLILCTLSFPPYLISHYALLFQFADLRRRVEGCQACRRQVNVMLYLLRLLALQDYLGLTINAMIQCYCYRFK